MQLSIAIAILTFGPKNENEKKAEKEGKVNKLLKYRGLNEGMLIQYIELERERQRPF